jgi:DNA-binding beta-propeller fold protein YncE
MSLRKLFLFSMVAALCLGRPAFSQDAASAKNIIAQPKAKLHEVPIAGGRTAQVIEGKTPAIKVTDADGKEMASIPLETNPGRFVYSESANTLFVVQSGKKGEDFISAVNLTTNQVDKNIKVGWNIISNLVVSKSANMLYVVHEEENGENFVSAVDLATNSVDKQIKVGTGVKVKLDILNGGRRLFCYTGGKETGGIKSLNTSYFKPPFEPITSVIDTASNELIATYNWFDNLRDDAQLKNARSFLSKRLFLQNPLAYGEYNGGALIINWDFDVLFLDHINLRRILIYSGQSSTPVMAIDPGGRIIGSTLSKDGKAFIMAIEGDKKTFGTLAVVDLENGKVVHHALDYDPKRLLRRGSKQEIWVFGAEEMLSVSEKGEIGKRRIPLNKTREKGDNSKNKVSDFQDAVFGEMIDIGDDHAAIMFSNLHKVALIDLKKLQVDAIIPTMDMTQKVLMQTATVVGGVAGSVFYGGGEQLLFEISEFSKPKLADNKFIAARSDGLFLYTLDTYGDKVTVIDVQAAKMIKRISVNECITKIQVSPDGNHLVCTGTVSETDAYNKHLNYSGPVTQQINLETNELEK